MGLRNLFGGGKDGEKPKYGIPPDVAQRVTASAVVVERYDEKTRTFKSEENDIFVELSNDARHGNELIVSADIVSKPLKGAVKRIYAENELIRKYGNDIGIVDMYETDLVTYERRYQPTIKISFDECDSETATGQKIVGGIDTLQKYLDALKETSEQQNRGQFIEFQANMG